jgi:uncharacterized protein YkwD
MKEIQVRATEAYEALTTEAGSLAEEERLDEAIALLAENVGRFRGTRHSFSLREKIEVFELEKKGETEAPEEVKEKVVRRHEFLRAAEDAEALAQRRKYGDAAVAYRQAATDCPFEDLVAEFTARADELAAFGSLFTELRSQIASHPARFRNITLGHGFKANAVGADDEHLAVAVRGAESRLSWSRMGTGRILALFLRLRLAPEGHLWLARYAFEAGDLDRAHAAVSTALEGDESLRETAFLILSRAKGVPVPEGGFVTYKKRWLTPAERSAAELADQIEDSERAAKSSDARRRDAALAELRELGETAKPALTRALDHQLLAAVEALETLPILKSPGTRQMLSGELETRRKAALALIFDTEKYPYPHPEGPAYDAVQAEVIQLVDKVREVWDRPIALILQKHPEALDIYSRAEGYSIELTSLGSPPATSFKDLVTRVNEKIGLKKVPAGGTSKKTIEWSYKVLDYNRLLEIDADAEERACVDAVNEYRMMMGLKAVKWNPKLLTCARAHSQHMKEGGFFAHNCPLAGPEHDGHRTPGQRAKLAGYGGGVSENIARGSKTGRGAFSQWFSSSGHHRNMLGSRHTEIGVGRIEDFWTQNFGSASKSVDVPRQPRGG